MRRSFKMWAAAVSNAAAPRVDFVPRIDFVPPQQVSSANQAVLLQDVLVGTMTSTMNAGEHLQNAIKALKTALANAPLLPNNGDPVLLKTSEQIRILELILRDIYTVNRDVLTAAFGPG